MLHLCGDLPISFHICQLSNTKTTCDEKADKEECQKNCEPPATSTAGGIVLVSFFLKVRVVDVVDVVLHYLIIIDNTDNLF